MKKYPWVPIACFILTLAVSYVAGVSGKALQPAACHSKANIPGHSVDGVVVQVTPNLEANTKWSQVNNVFAGEFYTFHGVKLKPPSDIFLAVGAKTFGPQTVTKQPPVFLNIATLGWQGGSDHNVTCCHTVEAAVDCGIPLRWKFKPVHVDVPAAGTVDLNGSVETLFTPVGSADCSANPGFTRKHTSVTFSITYSKSVGRPPKTVGSGSVTTSQSLQGIPLPPSETDISDNKLGPAGTKPLSHTFGSGSQFLSKATLKNSVTPGFIRATADSAVSTLGEIKWEINDFHLNDNIEGTNDKTDLGN